MLCTHNLQQLSTVIYSQHPATKAGFGVTSVTGHLTPWVMRSIAIAAYKDSDRGRRLPLSAYCALQSNYGFWIGIHNSHGAEKAPRSARGIA